MMVAHPRSAITVAWEPGQLAPDDAVVSGDPGTNTTWVARQFKIRKDQMFSGSGTVATLGPATEYPASSKNLLTLP